MLIVSAESLLFYENSLFKEGKIENESLNDISSFESTCFYLKLKVRSEASERLLVDYKFCILSTYFNLRRVFKIRYVIIHLTFSFQSNIKTSTDSFLLA